MMIEEPMKTTSIQLPGELLDKMREIAAVEERSLAGQIRFFLSEAVTRRGTGEHGADEEDAATKR